MGKNTKFIMDRYNESMVANFEEIVENTNRRQLLMAYEALRQRTETAMVTVVATALIDEGMENASHKVHNDPQEAYYEAVVLKKRLAVIDQQMATIEASLAEEDLAVENQMKLFDDKGEQDENVQKLSELTQEEEYLGVGGTD